MVTIATQTRGRVQLVKADSTSNLIGFQILKTRLLCVIQHNMLDKAMFFLIQHFPGYWKIELKT